MIISRYLLKEVIFSFIGVLMVLLLIALSAQLVGLFSKVASGELSINTVMELFALYTVSILVFIIPLAFYLAILLAFSRLYKDSEMVVLSACGISTGFVLRSVMGLAFVIAIIQAILSLQVAPWAENFAQQLTFVAHNKTDIQGITPGRFKELKEGGGVIYVEKVDPQQNRMENIFLQQRDLRSDQPQQESSIITAQSGTQYMNEDNGDRFMLLENGYRYQGEPGQENYTVIEFEKHGIRMKETSDLNAKNLKRKSIPTKDLWNSDQAWAKAELQWRASSAVMLIILAMLAVPLSKTSHRQGRYGKLAIAIVVYMLFTNLVSVAKTRVADGTVPVEIGLWWVHALMFLLAVFILWRQSRLLPFFNSRTRSSNKAAAR